MRLSSKGQRLAWCLCLSWKEPVSQSLPGTSSTQAGPGVQEEYAREGIDWSYVDFVDNQDCLDLLEGAAGAPALGVFPLIDEACRLPRATFQVLQP